MLKIKSVFPNWNQCVNINKEKKCCPSLWWCKERWVLDSVQLTFINQSLSACVQQEALQPGWVEELPVDYDVYLGRDTDPDALKQIHLYRVVWSRLVWTVLDSGLRILLKPDLYWTALDRVLDSAVDWVNSWVQQSTDFPTIVCLAS